MENKKTCLYSKHIGLNAQICPFGGFDMPIQYSGIEAEHNAVREHCGIFDVSHMGEVTIDGPEAENFIQYIFSNDVSKSTEGKILYGMMLNTHGGVVDDLLVYCKANKSYLLVINAANINKDLAWILEQSKSFDVIIKNRSDDFGQVAIQGPESEEKITSLLNIECSDLSFYTFKTIDVGNERVIISRTGYTGEDGFEIYGSPKYINTIWDTIVNNGITPCGLGCRDTLRFEVGLPLYGDELSDDITPIEAGLGMFVKTDKLKFVGKNAILKQKSEGTKRKLVGIELNNEDKAIPRHGYEIEKDGHLIGYVTTGYRSISTGKSVCMALIESSYKEIGTQVDVKIHKRLHSGTIVKRAFYNKHYVKQ